MVMQGTVLAGRYRLLDVLGDGGMARVFRAEDERLGRIVAVKVLHEHYLSQPQFVRRFEQEAQLAAGLSHPNIVAIYDVDRDGDTYFIVMEYVEGSSLKRVIVHAAPLPLDRITVIIRQLGLALDAAHARGVIHRDIKPENILLTPNDGVKVGDFGIARALTGSRQTATGMVLGSVSYFSPEQAQGKPATAESDLYSSGIVLYEMLTGRLPFVGGNPLATAMQQITQQPAPPRSIVPSLPPAVDAVVLKALDKNPAGRFHSGAAFADALAAAAIPARPVTAAGVTRSRAPTVPNPALPVRPTSSARAALPTTQRRRISVLPFLLLLLLLLGGGGVYAYIHRHGIARFLSGPPAAPPTATPASGAPSPTVNAVPIGGNNPTTTPAAAPLPTSTTVAAGNPTSTIGVASPTGTGVGTATPLPSVTAAQPSATGLPATTSTPVAVPAGVWADVATARSCALNGHGIPYIVGPQDSFSLDTSLVWAIMRFHHLPRGTHVAAEWIYPEGSHFTYHFRGTAYSTNAIYCADNTLLTPGTYTVSALADGRVLGSHEFTVTPRRGKTGHSSPAALPPGPVAQAPPAAHMPSGVVSVYGKARGRGHGYGGHRQDGGGDTGDSGNGDSGNDDQ